MNLAEIASRTEYVAETWIIPEFDVRVPEGIKVSTLQFGSWYETMVVGGPWDATRIIDTKRKDALANHSFWVGYLFDQYGESEEEEAEAK